MVVELSWMQTRLSILCSCFDDRAVPSGQVHQARAEAEAATEQRLAALYQARREEVDAAVRKALELGA